MKPYFHILANSSVLSVQIMPCKCMFSVPLCPSSVTSQCLTAFPYLLRHLSLNFLTACVAIALSRSYPFSCASSVTYLYLYLWHNFPFLSFQDFLIPFLIFVVFHFCYFFKVNKSLFSFYCK